MRKLNLSELVERLHKCDDSVRAKAYEVLTNYTYESEISDETKSKELLNIINSDKLDEFTLQDIINLFEFANTILFPEEIDSNYKLIPKEKWGVHETHCCLEHGCKYGDRNCPVATGQIKQAYMCEVCNYEF